jgi:hypothetical protein
MMIHFQRDSKGMFRFILFILFILAIPIIFSSMLSCQVTVKGEPYHQGPRPAHQEPRPAHLSSIEGSWNMSINNASGRLKFYWTRKGWTGQIFFDQLARWEKLTDVFFDPHTGQVQFHRPIGNQLYFGILSGGRIEGTFGPGRIQDYPWAAWRH